MKHFYLSLLFTLGALPLFAQTVTLSGKISGMGNEKLKISGLFFNLEIAPEADGSFHEVFDIGYNGSYTLKTLNSVLTVYLEKGMDLSIAADDKDFFTTVKFSGSRSRENQYFAAKSNFENGIVKNNLYALGESDYLQAINRMNLKMQQDFEDFKIPDPVFAEAEARSIKYALAAALLAYPVFHQGLAPDYKASAGFPKPEAAIDMDNEADFLFSMHYRELVFRDFTFKAYGKNAPKDKSASRLPFAFVKKYKSDMIRNALMSSFLYAMNSDDGNVDKIYGDLMANVTNDVLKDRINDKFNSIKNLNTGKPAPTFHYQDNKGEIVSLESFRGKYVYIDIWATWCAPCRAEIPALQTIEEKYKDSNIAFVSVSIDGEKDRQKWKNLVRDKNLGGTQLIAEGEWNSSIIRDFAISGIPRFILIDPDGNIVDSNAPKPSESKLTNLFKKLKL